MKPTQYKSFALRDVSMQEDGTFEGYAAIFNNVDSDRDLIEPGAFKRTLDHWKMKGKPVPILWQHNEKMPIGFTESIVEDEKGLRVKGRLLLDVQQAREAYALLKADVLGGLSIGFKTVREKWKANVRHLLELALGEYSLVTFPANELAVVTSVKAEAGDMELSDDLPTSLRDLSNAAFQAVGETLADETLGLEERSLAVKTAFNVFAERSADVVLLALENNVKQQEVVSQVKSLVLEETKAGKTLSKATRGKLDNLRMLLQDLLDTADAVEEEAETPAEEDLEPVDTQSPAEKVKTDFSSLANLTAWVRVKSAQLPRL